MAYPDYITDEHMEFLSEVNVPHTTVGLQSTNAEVLQRLHRKFDLEKFRRGVRRLSELTEVGVEIILGLPGDSPDSFMRSLDLVLGLGDRVYALVYHCLVLPDGLLTRAPDGAALEFDPYTLKVKSCDGWSERELGATHERVARMVEEIGGGYFFFGTGDRVANYAGDAGTSSAEWFRVRCQPGHRVNCRLTRASSCRRSVASARSNLVQARETRALPPRYHLRRQCPSR